jgi:murein DD-endopeptidase MepM/ murein hydrolase activator NlpD
MAEAGVPPALIMEFTDIFQWDVDFLVDCRRGDRFDLLVARNYILGNDGKWRPGGYAPIQRASYVAEDTLLRAYRYAGNRIGYFSADGTPFAKAFLRSPLNYRRISSYFSRGRRHPILKIVRPHNGVDFAAAYGTPVVAAGDGVVRELGYERRGMGRFVRIRHTNRRFETLYGHLSRYARGLKVGKRVRQGEVIAYVGSTGLSTGPHLHYTFKIDGRAVDPLRIPNPGLPPLDGEELVGFRREAQRLDSLAQVLSAEKMAREAEKGKNKL